MSYFYIHGYKNKTIASFEIEKNISLASLTPFGIGGSVKFFVEVDWLVIKMNSRGLFSANTQVGLLV